MPDKEKIQKPTIRKTPNRCPTEIPEPIYDIVVFENRFPSLSPNPPEPAIEPTELYPMRLARGECEVVVHTPTHNSTLANEPGGHISDFKF